MTNIAAASAFSAHLLTLSTQHAGMLGAQRKSPPEASNIPDTSRPRTRLSSRSSRYPARRGSVLAGYAEEPAARPSVPRIHVTLSNARIQQQHDLSNNPCLQPALLSAPGAPHRHTHMHTPYGTNITSGQPQTSSTKYTHLLQLLLSAGHTLHTLHASTVQQPSLSLGGTSLHRRLLGHGQCAVDHVAASSPPSLPTHPPTSRYVDIGILKQWYQVRGWSLPNQLRLNTTAAWQQGTGICLETSHWEQGTRSK
jgi:hypothetical protein